MSGYRLLKLQWPARPAGPGSRHVRNTPKQPKQYGKAFNTCIGVTESSLSQDQTALTPFRVLKERMPHLQNIHVLVFIPSRPPAPSQILQARLGAERRARPRFHSPKRHRQACSSAPPEYAAPERPEHLEHEERRRERPFKTGAGLGVGTV